MKATLRHIGAIGFTFLLLFSTFSFTVDLHYCGKHLVDFAINDEARGCAMDTTNADANGQDSEACKPFTMPCCQDVQLTFDGSEELQSGIFETVPQPPAVYIIGRLTFALQDASNEIVRAHIPHKDYLPPPLIRDVSILHQTFLI